MLTVAPGGNNLATICYKDFLGLATINMYYYYYYYYYVLLKEFHILNKTSIYMQIKTDEYIYLEIQNLPEILTNQGGWEGRLLM